MKETKLVTLFKSLSIIDLRQIQKMIRSPFYTTNEHLLTLFNLLRSSYPDCDSGKLEKHKVFKRLFPKHDYSDIKLRNLNSDMVRIIEDYLIYKEMKFDNIGRRKKMLRIYLDAGYLDWVDRELKKMIGELDKLPYRDAVYYKHMLDLRLIQLEYVEKKKLDSRYILLEEWEEMLDNYYEHSKARHKIAFNSLKKIVKPVTNNTNNIEKDKNVLLGLYQKIDQLYSTDNLDLFFLIKSEFEENIQLVRPNIQKELLKLLINFTIKQMKLDDLKYNKVTLELYQLGLKNKIIFGEGYLSDNDYFNIVACGAKAKAFDWTQNFIEEYEKYLSPNYKLDIKTISLSTFYLHKKEFSKAIDLIKTNQFSQFQINEVARMHAIRCYYELFLLDDTYYDLVITQIDSNERFMRRNKKLPIERFQTNLNFLNFIKKLIKIRTAGKLKEKEQSLMREELLKLKITLSRSWLLDIIKR